MQHQSMEVNDHLKVKAARLSKRRYVCFTKKWLCNEFVVMNESDCFHEIETYYEEQPLGSRVESSRLIFDQVTGSILRCHNTELVLQTLRILYEEDQSEVLGIPSVENSRTQRVGENPMLDQINRYSGWFTERARRTSWKRFVVFTKCTVPLDFIILNPEHSNNLSELDTMITFSSGKSTLKLIFDQEEQVVIRSTNDETVLETIVRIIENEIAEFEETGELIGEWRNNPVQYESTKNQLDVVLK